MKEKMSFYAALTVTVCGVALAVYLFFRYLFALLFPFLVGWGIALVVRRPAAALNRRLGLDRGICRLLLALCVLVAVGSAVFFGLRGLFYELSLLLARVETGSWDWEFYVDRIWKAIPLPDGLLPPPEDFLPSLTGGLLRALPGAVSALAGFLPSFFLSLAVSFTATLYFCLDLDRVHAALGRLMPRFLHVLRKSAVSAALSALRANLILMLIAFAVMLPGFLLFRVPYPLLLSLAFSLLDLLPVIGAGAFLLPLSLLYFFLGDTYRGIGVLLILLAVALIRQFVEPHLLGAKVGLHPLLGLLSLYAGERLFGFVGLLVFPFLALFLCGLLFPDRAGKKKTGAAPWGGPKKKKS